MFARFGHAIIRHRWGIIASTAVFVAASGWGVTRLTATSDPRVFFSDNNPYLAALEDFEDVYSRDEIVLIVLEPSGGSVFTRASLAAIEELTEAAWTLPHSSRVDSITNFQHTWARDDELIVEDLVQNASSLSKHQLERIQTVALSEPLLVNRLVSPSGHVTGISIKTAMQGVARDENTEVAMAVRRIADEFRRDHPDIHVYLTGGVMIDRAFTEATEQDMRTLIPIMFAVMAAAILLLLSSMTGTLATLIVITASSVTAMGLAGWYGVVLTPPTAIAPIVILTLAVADSIHILSRVFYGMRAGRSQRVAIVESLQVNLHPVFLTSLTTAIGFLSLNTSDVPPMRELGNIVAIGVTAAFVYSVLLLPALMAVLPARARGRCICASSISDHIGAFVVRHRRASFGITVAVMIVFAAGLPRLKFSDDFVSYFDESFDVRTASDFTEAHLTGLDLIEHSIEAGEEGGISDPDYLRVVDEVATWYRRQPEVRHVSAITDTMRRLNRNMHGDDDAHFALPSDRELAAQYLLLYEMSLPFGLDLNSRIDVDRSATRLSVIIDEPSTAKQIAFEERTQAWIAERGLTGQVSRGTGLTLMWAHISKRNIESMLGGVAVALVLISFLLVLALRSARIGLLSLLPNLLPAIMAFGLWGLLVGRVNLGTSIVAVMSFGIVVDDTVHFLSKYLRARRMLQLDALGAVQYAFKTVGMAMLTTSAVLAAGFLVLTLSGFGMNSGMGLLTAIVIALALLADFFFLPPLLLKLEGQRC